MTRQYLPPSVARPSRRQSSSWNTFSRNPILSTFSALLLSLVLVCCFSLGGFGGNGNGVVMAQKENVSQPSHRMVLLLSSVLSLPGRLFFCGPKEVLPFATSFSFFFFPTLSSIHSFPGPSSHTFRRLVYSAQRKDSNVVRSRLGHE